MRRAVLCRLLCSTVDPVHLLSFVSCAMCWQLPWLPGLSVAVCLGLSPPVSGKGSHLFSGKSYKFI